MNVIGFLLELAFLYIIVRIFWAVFRNFRRRGGGPKTPRQPKPGRFDAKGKDIAEGHFEEIK